VDAGIRVWVWISYQYVGAKKKQWGVSGWGQKMGRKKEDQMKKTQCRFVEKYCRNWWGFGVREILLIGKKRGENGYFRLSFLERQSEGEQVRSRTKWNGQNGIKLQKTHIRIYNSLQQFTTESKSSISIRNTPENKSRINSQISFRNRVQEENRQKADRNSGRSKEDAF
jgi:hypothetical protein